MTLPWWVDRLLLSMVLCARVRFQARSTYFCIKKKGECYRCEGEFSLKVLILFIKDKTTEALSRSAGRGAQWFNLYSSVSQLIEGLSGLSFLYKACRPQNDSMSVLTFTAQFCSSCTYLGACMPLFIALVSRSVFSQKVRFSERWRELF